jgi:Thiamine pyrophosphate-requiring enzymes [acetolactate synthase, pyruvate dehydrogenase (cytochrome), glyoxylate carboligase, phosphonopyruvate decarboxylase]
VAGPKPACRKLAEFAEKQGLPVAVSLRSQGLMDNDHPNYVGHFGIGAPPYLTDALADTDLLLAIGPRLGEMTTAGYTLLTPPTSSLDLVHVFPQGEELGRVYEPALAIVADTQSFCESVAAWAPLAPDRFAERTRVLRDGFLRFNEAGQLPDDPLAQMFDHLAETLPQDAILCNGAGNYAGWLHRFYRYRAVGSQLAPTSGSMGYGLPAAIGAALAAPDREVFVIAGTGVT